MRKGSKKSTITKEQLHQQQERNYERQFVKEKFFPALSAATISIDEAGFLLQAATSLIMEEALETLKIKKMSEIHDRVLRKLDPDGERPLAIENLLNLFDKQTLFKARGYLEGMKAVLEQIKIDEMQKKSLKDLDVNWERYLTK